MAALRIGIVDSGVNPWHSHVGGPVAGCRIYLTADGCIAENGDFRDVTGHGTALAGVIREAFPDVEIFAVRVFDAEDATYPSLLARGILRAAGAGCDYVNLSVCVPAVAGSHTLATACAAALEAGAVLVASASWDLPDGLPASLPGVHAVTADDSLAFGEVRVDGPRRLRAPGRPRDLAGLPRDANLWGHSFACARGLVYLARRELARRGAAAS